MKGSYDLSFISYMEKWFQGQLTFGKGQVKQN